MLVWDVIAASVLWLARLDGAAAPAVVPVSACQRPLPVRSIPDEQRFDPIILITLFVANLQNVDRVAPRELKSTGRTRSIVAEVLGLVVYVSRSLSVLVFSLLLSHRFRLLGVSK